MSDTEIYSFALGLASKDSKGGIIEVYYPDPRLNPSSEIARVVLASERYTTGNGFWELSKEDLDSLQSKFFASDEKSLAEICKKIRLSDKVKLLTVIRENNAPSSIPEAFLQLHLLSHRLAKPNELNLDGIFSILRNIAWTNKGAITVEDLPKKQLEARIKGEVLEVYSIDKFPKMTNYIVPDGVRVADAARIRLGAHIGEGTTVMHEGFVNFNAGTEGTAMVEGRVSAGVVIGENTDLGGSCSTMGTLSGGGTEIISVGKNCLIGANAGIGIPLADGCIVEAGLYVTAGTKVNLIDGDGKLIKTVKAKEISSIKDLLFRRNSLSGAVECIPTKSTISLNDALHSHN